MYIREAFPEDSIALQQLQAMCPQGTSLIVTSVNTPDFFARVKAYEKFKVFVACEGSNIIGSAACAIRNAAFQESTKRIGYEFQYFTSPQYRRKGISSKLRQRIEEYLSQENAVISYALIMEGNSPSTRLFELQGFRKNRDLIMPGIALLKQLDFDHIGLVRPARIEDFSQITDLINHTWRNHVLFEPISIEALHHFIHNTPLFDLSSMFVLESRNEILACVGCWDWSHIMRVTVKTLSIKMQILRWLMVPTGIFPNFPKPGDTLKQMLLTHIGFNTPQGVIT